MRAMRTVSMFGVLMAVHATCYGTPRPEPPCPRGFLAIQAQITRVEPADAVLKKRAAAGGRLVDAAVGTFLCEGDTLEPATLESATPAQAPEVELYEAGKTSRVGLPYRVRSGVPARLQGASAYLSVALEGLSELGVPPARSIGTSSRGLEASDGPPRPVRDLRDLPPQRLAVGVAAVASWRGGTAPYSCETLNPAGEVIWRQGNAVDGWCSFPASDALTRSLVVRDGRGRSAGWDVIGVAVDEVPRPDWLADVEPDLSDEDIAAWAIWVWEQGGGAWRLQALGMLDAVAQRQWLARSFVDHVLAENPPVIPQ